jgi:16S rRNA (uracil1498-N3)-methyltransferase
MSSLWLHIPAIPEAGDSVVISRDEARHAFGARRLGTGDLVTLFDGQGTIAEGRLTDARTRGGDVVVEIASRTGAAPLAPEVTIAFAVPKGDRLSTLLDGATQAGVSRLVPIACARSVVDADKLDRGERWQRILAEATKVAKRAWMPELVAGGDLLDVARAERARGAAIAVAHTSNAEPLSAWRDALAAEQPRTVFIGPEGGFDDDELADLRALGAAVVTLGPCVMRVEMAAMAAAVLLRG